MFIVQLLVLLGIIFVGLIVIMQKIMGQHVTTATSHLKGLSQDYLKRQQDLKERLEGAQQEYQAQLLKGQQEARQIQSQAAQEAEAAKERLLNETRQEAERIVQQAMQAREALQHELVRAMESKAIERACELIERVLPDVLQKSIHTEWLDELLTHGLVHAEHLKIREDVKEACVTSAFPLNPSQHELLLDKLQVAVGHSVLLEEKVDPHLIAGLIITMGHWVLDAALSSKIREAARHAQQEN